MCVCVYAYIHIYVYICTCPDLAPVPVHTLLYPVHRYQPRPRGGAVRRNGMRHRVLRGLQQTVRHLLLSAYRRSYKFLSIEFYVVTMTNIYLSGGAQSAPGTSTDGTPLIMSLPLRPTPPLHTPPPPSP